MASAGWKVTAIEKNSTLGAGKTVVRRWLYVRHGSQFPLMPDVFERYFAQFGKRSLIIIFTPFRPFYRIYFNDGYTDMLADLFELKSFLNPTEPGSAEKLENILKELPKGHEVGVKSWL
ncbi:MAG: hypothetical protein IPN29_01125 [Saprospiraceae bacterium]|nr:hypothetical protein [Saprospiraceae bacterium]